MTERPHILDNLSPETEHGAGLRYLLDRYEGEPVSITTGYVNLDGLHHLAVAVSDGRTLRLLLGAEPDPALGAQLPTNRFELALRTLAADRDLSRFPPSRAAERLHELESWLEQDNVEVRRYLERFVHGKAYLFGRSGDGEAALVTSANLTGAGLTRNYELGLVDYNPPQANAALAWFDGLWEQAVDYKSDLRKLLFPDAGLLDPRTVYLRALLELYGEETDLDLPASRIEAVNLAPFQKDGYDRARRILARHHGVVYADGVGTGKTEIGLAFIEEYALKRGHHALVVTPAQLRDNWTERIDQSRLPAQVISFNELARDEQLHPDGGDTRRVLHNARDSYRLIVVDEAHALRNPDTTWYRAMTRLLGGERKDVVLLTATPVNNGLWDLYHMVMLFARHDRGLASVGIGSIRDVFVRAGANARDPENLDPDVLFPVADAVSVRRDRRFIEQHYPDATFPDGTPVRFPRPHLSTERYDLDATDPGLFTDIVGRIDKLTMARYRPSAYEVGREREAGDEATLGALLQSAILKRFESCWSACLATVERMARAHELFLAAWDAGAVPSGDVLRAAARDEVDEAGIATWVTDEIADDADTRPVDEFRPEYRDAVATDLDLLHQIRDRLSELDANSDPKLLLLRRLLAEMPDEKVAVFSTFGETVRYLDQHLPHDVGDRTRIAVIGTETGPDERATALSRFSPDTVVRPGYVPPDGEVDLLVSTDVLSEGQNLQQAGAVISYDMPWNPQRVVQRNGRVIRLRSPHDEVHLVTMLPQPGELEDLLRLEATIRRKIVAASIYGMESAVLDDIEPELRAYAERLEGGDETLLEEDGDDLVGTFAGEELRATLMRALREGEVARLRSLPWGIGTAFEQGEVVPSRGPGGIFLACRTESGERYWRYIEDDGAMTDSDAEILRRINPGTAPGLDTDELHIDLEASWEGAIASIIEEHNDRADPRKSEQRLRPAQRFALDLLRDPSVALPAGAERAEEALVVDRGARIGRELSEIRRLVAEGTISRDEAAVRILELVDTYGLQPAEPGPTLRPIGEDDVGVVCWMGVRRAGEV